MQSQRARIEAIAPELRALVKHHEEGTYKGGVEAFNTTIMQKIDSSGLMESEVKLTVKVGVHPDNRERAMLVPVDCQDLLLKFADNGYNPGKWDALALRIPPGPVGDAWRAANVTLVDASDGLLAPISADSIEIVTGRGSHGTAALRLATLGGRSIHAELADQHGQVSKAKLLEMQPSWTEPLEKGVLYKVLPGELELAVPGLLACLSRIGNASNDVFRQQTTLQMCARIHSMIASKMKSGGDAVDLSWVAKQSCVGNGGASMVPKALQLIDFVKAWSGGREGQHLRDLEKFERSIAVKRKLAPSDLQNLAGVDLLHAPKYVPATRLVLQFIVHVVCLHSARIHFANTCEQIVRYEFFERVFHFIKLSLA
jgi:hypothetical protein